MTTSTEHRDEGALRKPQSPLAQLSAEQVEELGQAFDRIHEEVFDDLGTRDRRYILSIIALQRRLAAAGRVLLFASHRRPAWVAGTAALSLAKILENMEIGHNVMHGQWDWMNDPDINSATWDWDTASTAEAWKHSHNYIHHTFTNIRGKDKDLGYEIMRIDPHQSWHPVYLLQPIYNVLLMLGFEWGVAFHDMDIEAIVKRDKPLEDVWHDLKGIAGKARRQVQKDYVAWPALAAAAAVAAVGVRALAEDELGLRRRSRADAVRDRIKHPIAGGAASRRPRPRDVARRALQTNAGAAFTANVVRNVWSYSIIFCGHFPDQTCTFSEEEVEDETRGGWYVRQLVGAANIEGGPLFHVISGNLGYQVEHHLFPDMPSTRYGQIAPQVREICKRYGLPYNSGPLAQQLGMVQRSILRLAFPGGQERPKPGPYGGPAVMTKGEQALQQAAATS